MTDCFGGMAGRVLATIVLALGLWMAAKPGLERVLTDTEVVGRTDASGPIGQQSASLLVTTDGFGSVCSTPIGECAAANQSVGNACGCHFGIIGTPFTKGSVINP